MRSEPGEKWCNDSPDKVGRCQHNWDNKENENNSYNETSVWWGWRCLTWTPRRRWKKIYDTQKLDRSEARKNWWKCIPRFLPHRHLCYQGHNDPLGPSDRQQNNDNQLTFSSSPTHSRNTSLVKVNYIKERLWGRLVDFLFFLFSGWSFFFFRLFGFYIFFLSVCLINFLFCFLLTFSITFYTKAFRLAKIIAWRQIKRFSFWQLLKGFSDALTADKLKT